MRESLFRAGRSGRREELATVSRSRREAVGSMSDGERSAGRRVHPHQLVRLIPGSDREKRNRVRCGSTGARDIGGHGDVVEEPTVPKREAVRYRRELEADVRARASRRSADHIVADAVQVDVRREIRAARISRARATEHGGSDPVRAPSVDDRVISAAGEACGQDRPEGGAVDARRDIASIEDAGRKILELEAMKEAHRNVESARGDADGRYGACRGEAVIRVVGAATITAEPIGPRATRRGTRVLNAAPAIRFARNVRRVGEIVGSFEIVRVERRRRQRWPATNLDEVAIDVAAVTGPAARRCAVFR